MSAFLISCFNFGILGLLLFFKLKRPLVDFVAQRHSNAKIAYQAIQERKIQAENALREIEKKLERRPMEVRELRVQQEQALVRLKEQSGREIQQFSDEMLREAQRRIQQMEEDMKFQLLAEWGLEWVEETEQKLLSSLGDSEKIKIQQAWVHQAGEWASQ